MTIKETPIKGLFEIEPRVFGDARGHFFESYSARDFKEAGIDIDFVQDNQSLSSKGVLRGLHFQNPPYAQDKLVRVIQGAVLDVAVDVRKASPTYGEWYAVELTAENKKSLLIPKGFAHGFLTLEDQTIFCYKCSDFYHPEAEGGIRWNDPDLAINWNFDSPQINEKDQQQPLFMALDSLF